MRYLPLVNFSSQKLTCIRSTVRRQIVYGRCARRMRSRIEVGVLKLKFHMETPYDAEKKFVQNDQDGLHAHIW